MAVDKREAISRGKAGSAVFRVVNPDDVVRHTYTMFGALPRHDVDALMMEAQPIN
jgi:hypothetical protein